MVRKYQIYTRCAMDTSDANIIFTDSGLCDHCVNFDKNILLSWEKGKYGEIELKKSELDN